jgi:hypothetical protein
MNPLYVISAAAFPLLTVMFFFLLVRLLNDAIQRSAWTEEKKKTVKSRIVITILLWAVIISVLSLTGVTGNFNLFPLNFAPLIIAPLVIILFATFSRKTTDLLQHVSRKNIVQLQVFRLFVEIVLWMLFIQNLAPEQMTFEGRNLDILSGITAPLVAYFFSNNRKVMIAWNLICLGFLINIVAVAILSLPSPFRVFMNEPANTIVTKFPFIFLPGFLVPLAYGLHFLSLKQLLNQKIISTRTELKNEPAF